jgi:acyl transferase domain-containing protein
MSEGAVVYYLTSKSRAKSMGLPILAEFAASAVAHAGKSRGILRPTSASQEKLIRTCMERAMLTPADIDYVEG